MLLLYCQITDKLFIIAKLNVLYYSIDTMSYTKSLLIAIFIVGIGTPIYAETCSCLWQGSFINITDKADLIVSGQIIQHKGNSLDIHIDRILLDKALNGKEFNEHIRIWGDYGDQCRPHINQFALNSHWVMALNKITKNEPDGFNPSTPNISFGRINDYYLSKCGAYWLKLHDGYVTGNLLNGRRWEWENNEMNPVLLELIDAYIKDILPEQALTEAAKPQTEAKKLMESTKTFINSQ